MSKLYVLIGIPGSGKSTVAQIMCVNNDNIKIMSSDELRKIMFNNEDDQSHNKEVFQKMNEQTVKFLNSGFDVIYDATNINARNRKNLLCYIDKNCNSNVEKTAIYINTPLDTCINRQALRKRKVPNEVIERMYNNIQIPTEDEGFDFMYEYKYVFGKV